MKKLLLTSALFLSLCVFAQNDLVAFSDLSNNDISVSRAQDVMLGEYDVKSGKGRALGRDAYFFENKEKTEGVFLKSFLFKVDKANHRTKANIRFYKKKEFVQEVYLDLGTLIYPSFVPGDVIEASDIVVYIEAGQKGIVEIDLSQYNIAMPANGLFVSLEGDGYFDVDGNKIASLKSKDLTQISFRPSVTDNYCGSATLYGQDSEFWINNNKSLKTDFKYSFKKEVPQKMLVAPNF